MKRPFILALIAIATTHAMAQTLDNSNVPIIGDEWLYVNCGPITLDGTGADQIWDAGDATSVGNVQGIQCLSPLNTTAGDYFPDAQFALGYAGTTTYLQADADGMYVIGIHVSSLPITSTYTDPLRQLAFPATLGDTWSDGYVGSYTYDDEVVDQNGEMTCTVSGIGDMILPWGTVENVLRLDITETYTEEGLGNTYVMERTLSEFYRPGLRTYLARLYSISTSLNGVPGGTSEGFLYVEEDAFTGLSDAHARSIGMEVFPNPAAEQATVILGSTGNLSLTLFDAAGKAVLRQAPTTAPGLIKATLDLQALPAGVYSLRAQSSNGDTGSTRLVVIR
ncbi:MAG: T9SS type A sorting domain-containing protein [Flavobacteriales bacterium]|nr:T9SS type A sorting domain-containing protein [Flavobacteriales bacterium]